MVDGMGRDSLHDFLVGRDGTGNASRSGIGREIRREHIWGIGRQHSRDYGRSWQHHLPRLLRRTATRPKCLWCCQRRPLPPLRIAAIRMCRNWGCLVWFCLRSRSRATGSVHLQNVQACLVCARGVCVYLLLCCVFTKFCIDAPREQQSMFKKKHCMYFVDSRYFELCTADTARTRSISRFSTAETSGLAVFRGSVLWLLQVVQVCRVLYCGYHKYWQ